MKILAIQNCSAEGFGCYERYLLAWGIEVRVVHAYRDDPLPAVNGVDAILVGGTPISAYVAHEHAFLRRECEYLRLAMMADKACFGICCGGQVLAQLLGASVGKCAQKEIGGYEVWLTDAGQRDGVLNGFPARFPVFHWHGDTFAVPDGGELLVEGEGCRNQMFRRGNVIGVQFHLEVTSREAGVWAEEYADELAACGKTRADVIRECQEREEEMVALAGVLMENFLKLATNSGAAL